MTGCGEAGMIRLWPVALLVVVFLSLPGCAGVMNVSLRTDKDITLNDITNIKAGMSESEVIERLGRPLFFGVDRDGLEFLHYESGNMVGKGAAIPTPVIGADSTSFEVKGWAAGIYIEHGVVKKTGYTVYQDNTANK